MMNNATPAAGRSPGLAIFLGVLLIISGVLAIGLPFIAGLAVNLVVGWLLIFGGVAHLAFAWSHRDKGGLALGILLGIVYLAAGMYMVFNPVIGLVTLTLVLASYLMVEAVLEIVLAFRMRPRHGWGWTLFDGILTLALAMIIWASWPISTLWAIGTLVGISMIFSGVARVMLAAAGYEAMPTASAAL